LSKVLKWVGNKALDGIQAGGKAIGTEIDKQIEESKRKRAVYKDEYDKALKRERESIMRDRDNAIREKARVDAKKRTRG